MAEQEVSIIAKLIDMITSPIKVVIEGIQALLGVSKEVESEETLTPALTGWQKILNALILIFPALDPILGGFVKGIDVVTEAVEETQETVGEYIEAAETLKEVLPKVKEKTEELTEELGKEDEAIEKVEESADELGEEIVELSGEFSGLSGSAAAAEKQIAALRAELALLKSKTITITVIRRTVYRTEGKGGGGGRVGGVSEGSNPYSDNGGRPTLSTAEGKEFTEQVTLPALRTLAREGKIDKVVH